MEEIFSTIQSKYRNNAACPDGFNGFFYSFCLEIIKQDLFDEFLDLFAGFELSRS